MTASLKYRQARLTISSSQIDYDEVNVEIDADRARGTAGVGRRQAGEHRTAAAQVRSPAGRGGDRAREPPDPAMPVALRPAHTKLFPHIDFAGTRISTVAERLGVTKQAVSQLCGELAELGVVALESRPGRRAGEARPLHAQRARGNPPRAGRAGWDRARARRSGGRGADGRAPAHAAGAGARAGEARRARGLTALPRQA